MTNPKNYAYQAYKEFIDALVGSAYEGGGGPRLENIGKVNATLGENEYPYRDLVASLTESQRQVLVNILRKERCDAFHDVLAQLSWWLEDRNVKMTIDNELVPTGIEGDMHNDFVGRCLGLEWSKNC